MRGNDRCRQALSHLLPGGFTLSQTNSLIPRIAVTMGDPAGVGPELCLRLLAETALHALGTPIVFADQEILRRVAERCSLPVPQKVLPLARFREEPISIREPTVIDFGQDFLRDLVPGHVSAAAGQAAFAYVSEAIDCAMHGVVDALCTTPLHKEALHAAGVPFPGHTEILTALTASPKVRMMLTSPEITCTLVTAHVGLHEVPGLLSVEAVYDTIELTAQAMRRLRGREPHLVVCGLNPHAGEHGLFGNREEERFIVPAIEQARAQGLNVIGPLSPDTAFLPSRRKNTDAYICMYHDQGLIPLKALAFDEGINVTLGLPIVRTSVDHGTAFDIAWQGIASPNSLWEAFRLAVRLAGGRIPTQV